MRTYFNLDQKRLLKQQPQVEPKKQQTKQNPQVQNLFIEPEKQLWDIEFKDSLTQFMPTIENKKRIEINQFKPGSSFIKPNQQPKTDQEINKEIKKVIKETTNEFFEEIREQKRIKEQEKQQVEAQEVQLKEQDNDQMKDEKENINNNNMESKLDEGLLKRKIGKYQQNQGSNFVRLDLKRKYQDKFRGALYLYQKRFKRNGTLKNPPKNKREQNQIDFQQLNNQGQSASYNIFIQSVSSGLLVNIFDEEENLQLKEKQEQEIVLLIKEIKKDLDNTELYIQLLNEVFGYEAFREGQLEAIQSILKNESMLLVQKTGHGKSLVYQYLSLFLEDGVGIIFSPLISLMIDQISKLPDYIKGIAYHSMLTSFQKNKLLQYIKDKQVQLIFCTPEIFQSDLGYNLDQFGKVQFICIDEAHCISELSHSFRHTYITLDLMIKNFLKDNLPPYLALTATATQQTIESILSKFQIQKSIVSIDTERQNIQITISRDRDTNAALIKLLQSEKFKNLNSIIIYCRSKYMVDTISNYLRNCNLKCVGFHGSMTEQDKMDIQNKFIRNQVSIIVATSIFAMGIDKQDIRAIIHMNMPKSIEAYIQEIGRAGRDGNPAYAHLFLREQDYHSERSFILADHSDFTTLKNLFERIKLKQDQNQITYFISKYLEESLDLRKDSLYSLMQIIERCSENSIKVYPICHEKIILKYFKSLTQEEKEKSPFLCELIKIGKKVSETLHINVIKASNHLQMQPLEVIKQARNLFTDYLIKTEVQEEIFPFQILKPLDIKILEKANEILIQHKQVALDKLNIMYLQSFENSVANVDLLSYSIQNKKQFYFNIYFTSQNPIQEIIQKIFGENLVDINEYLPFEELDDEKQKQLRQSIQRFILEETVNKTQTESSKLTSFYLKNPKILAKLLCGIQSIKYSYQEYKKSSIWGQSGRLKFELVQQFVVDLCIKKQIIIS